jgi:Tol biopolymer transport system component
MAVVVPASDSGSMNEHPPTSTLAAADNGRDGRLDSWKKIASYLKRDVSTVQRWERRESMPVHRHQHDKLGSVYAYRSEIDQWWAGRAVRLARESVEASGLATAAKPGSATSAWRFRLPGHRLMWAGAALALAGAAAVVLWALRHADVFWTNPLANAQFRPLTDFEGSESAATISRDGTQVAFLADRDGHMDVWATRVGSGKFRNLTNGSVRELVNPAIRTLGFSPDAALVSIWSRQPDGSRPEDINLLAAPPGGGALRPYLAQAAEYDWSADGRVVYHSTAPGDPMFVKTPRQSAARHLYTAPAGEHCHFPIWSPDGKLIYLVCGQPPDKWDIWRIAAEGGPLERITAINTRVSHPVFLDPDTLAYLATDKEDAGPWLYSLDLRQRTIHRLTSGIEHYTSLAASADAMRLVVTVAAPKTTLWRLTLGGKTGVDAQMARLPMDNAHASSPRLGPGYLLYVVTEGGSAGLWKLADGTATAIWNGTRARVVASPAIARDGQHISFVTESDGHTQLHVVRDDGTESRVLSSRLDLRGTPAWAPDGKSVTCAIDQNGTPRLHSFPLNADPPVLLVSEYSVDPSWSPDGRFLVYSGPDVGTTFPLRAAAADGRALPLPSLVLTRGARRVAFLREPDTLLVLRGTIEHKDFWSINLADGTERQLTHVPSDATIGDFDVSADGNEIIFDRLQVQSDLVLIDRARH